MNRTFLLAADIAVQCQHHCELRLRHLDRGGSALLAAAPLLSLNTVRLQLPIKRGRSLSLEAACAAGRSCHASGQVVVDNMDMLQQGAASTDDDHDGMSSAHAVKLLPQSIVVRQTAGDAVAASTAVNAHQSLPFANKQLVFSTISVIALFGLQCCLLQRVRGQGHTVDLSQ